MLIIQSYIYFLTELYILFYFLVIVLEQAVSLFYFQEITLF